MSEVSMPHEPEEENQKEEEEGFLSLISIDDYYDLLMEQQEQM